MGEHRSWYDSCFHFFPREIKKIHLIYNIIVTFCLNFKIIFDRIRQSSACEKSELLSSASFSLSFMFVKKRTSRTGCVFKEWNIRKDRDCVFQYGNRRENTGWIIAKHYLSLISSTVSKIVCDQFIFSNCSNFKRYVYYSYL